MTLADSSPPTASDNHVWNKAGRDVNTYTRTLPVFNHTSLCKAAVCVCINLMLGELSPQTADVLASFWDLRLQAGWVSQLWILLVHTLHLLQRVTEVRSGLLFRKWKPPLRTFLLTANKSRRAGLELQKVQCLEAVVDTEPVRPAAGGDWLGTWVCPSETGNVLLQCFQPVVFFPTNIILCSTLLALTFAGAQTFHRKFN